MLRQKMQVCPTGPVAEETNLDIARHLLIAGQLLGIDFCFLRLTPSLPGQFECGKQFCETYGGNAGRFLTSQELTFFAVEARDGKQCLTKSTSCYFGFWLVSASVILERSWMSVEEVCALNVTQQMSSNQSRRRLLVLADRCHASP